MTKKQLYNYLDRGDEFEFTYKGKQYGIQPYAIVDIIYDIDDILVY